MDLLSLDIAAIVDLGTRIANTGAIRVAEVAADGMFEYIVAVAAVIYEQDPNG